MPNIGVSELVVILLILMLVFGASRLPKLGESMGKAIRNFKRAVAQNENIQVSEIKEDERKRLQDSKTGSEITDAEVIDEKRGA
ncbi:MAG TPA: twin-arginine translocase TatA/TatE family subunit [Polyangiales bacterium]|jgi:sec-independent protein translocase protein TatA|nr:twin-arginine translocase TatA/TatE family subunit [Polyangiales bacterium]